ncbi:MAG TPA: HEPN domain-containing protein, partial [Candidatus Obscuribacterales bacterium]
LHLKASIPSAVMRDGRCLYACPSAKHLIAPPAPASHRVSEPIQPPYDPVRVENTRDWIRVARDDLRIAELLLQQEMFDQCLFHCQQSVEKALKALLTWHDEPVPRSHALPDLGACCLRLAPSIMPELRASYELARWAVDGRYPPPKSNPSEAAFGLRLARQAVDALMSEIPSSVRAI